MFMGGLIGDALALQGHYEYDAKKVRRDGMDFQREGSRNTAALLHSGPCLHKVILCPNILGFVFSHLNNNPVKAQLFGKLKSVLAGAREPCCLCTHIKP